jgi:HK97 family phage major capsid protein
MPTIKDLINDLEAQRRAADRTISNGTATVQQMIDRSKAEGGKNFTAEEGAKITALRNAVDAAKSSLPKLDQHLAAARQAQAEEDANDELMKTRTVNPHVAAATRPHGEHHFSGAGGGSAYRDDPAGGRRWVRTGDRKPAAVGRSERFGDHEIVREFADARSAREQAVIGQHGSLGQMVRAMSTTSGSAIVPTVWLGDVIDKARNLSAVLKAGAEIVPMDAKTVQIGRLTADPTAAFRTEGSTITASDPTFDNLTLDSKTMSALVVGSIEWFQDANNVDEVVSNAIAQAFAERLDRMALFGGVTTGAEVGATGFNETYATPPNPRGVLATLLAVAASSVLGGAANGTAQTALSYWNEIVQTIFLPRTFNEEPNALLWSAKGAQQYAMAYDSTGQPVAMPPAVAEMQRIITNTIPSNLTQGTMTTRATDVFAGDWTQLLIGQRLDVRIETLTERYAENGQVGIVAHWRGDFGLARPRAFSVYRFLQGAV